jgi:hypothetical protein
LWAASVRGMVIVAGRSTRSLGVTVNERGTSKRTFRQSFVGLWMIIIGTIGASYFVLAFLDPNGYIVVNGIKESSRVIRGLAVLAWVLGIVIGVAVLKHGQALQRQFEGSVESADNDA